MVGALIPAGLEKAMSDCTLPPLEEDADHGLPLLDPASSAWAIDAFLFPSGGTPDYDAEFQRHIHWTIGGTSPSLPDQVLRVYVYPVDGDEGMDVHAGFRMEVRTLADGQLAPGIEPWVVRNRGYGSPTRLNGKLVYMSLREHGIKPEWQD